MQEGASSSGLTSALFDDCYYMSLDFTHVIHDHCPREAKATAHELTRLARSSTHGTWMDDAPWELIQIIVKNLMLLVVE